MKDYFIFIQMSSLRKMSQTHQINVKQINLTCLTACVCVGVCVYVRRRDRSLSLPSVLSNDKSRANPLRSGPCAEFHSTKVKPNNQSAIGPLSAKFISTHNGKTTGD